MRSGESGREWGRGWRESAPHERHARKVAHVRTKPHTHNTKHSSTHPKMHEFDIPIHIKTRIFASAWLESEHEKKYRKLDSGSMDDWSVDSAAPRKYSHIREFAIHARGWTSGWRNPSGGFATRMSTFKAHSGGFATPMSTLPPLTSVANTGSGDACVLAKRPESSVPCDSTTSPLGSLKPVPHTLHFSISSA